MNFFKKMAIGVATVAMATSAVVGSAMAWEPTKPVDFIIMAGKGGGADKMARLMQSIVEKEGLSARPLVPTNKSGGSGGAREIATPQAPADARLPSVDIAPGAALEDKEQVVIDLAMDVGDAVTPDMALDKGRDSMLGRVPGAAAGTGEGLR